LSVPLSSTKASFAASASNLLPAEVNGRLVIPATCFAKSSAKPFLVLSPVPTAVPPCASSYIPLKVDFTLSIPFLIWAA